MSNFLPNTPIENIGALELNGASVLLFDGALEASAGYAMAGPSYPVCHPTIIGPGCIADDAALEAAAVAAAGPTKGPCSSTIPLPNGCISHDDAN